ncbi:NUDIX domain-containing protein [Haloarchaeobius sp. DFWS5]|uniref:NUDIX domain-containing protein n=1 Tax=Haloarchaeobius sp. DFWS5 TaxID=3446114 RepID=UPI003EB741E9
MPPQHNADEVQRRIDRLRDEYDEVMVTPDRDEPLEDFASLRDYAEDGYIGGAYCIAVRRPEQEHDLTESMPDDAHGVHDHCLLAKGRGSDQWGPPGGGLEGFDPAEPGTGETYEEAAVREVEEETNVQCEIRDDSRVNVYHLVVEDSKSAAEVHLAYVVFEASYVGGHIEIQPGELNGAAWFAELPAARHPSLQRCAAWWQDV